MPDEQMAEIALRANDQRGESLVLSYRVPKDLRGLIREGQLVWAPLRRRKVQGVVLSLAAAPPTNELREVAGLGDPAATITSAGVALARWVAETYRAPLYEALSLLLPPGVGQEARVTWQATAAGFNADLGALPERERAILYYLRRHGETSERDLRHELRGSDSELREAYGFLAERGYLTPGAALSAPRARPRVERLAQLTIAPSAVDATVAGLQRAPRQQAALMWMVERGRAQSTEHRAQSTEHRTGEPGNLGTANRALRTQNPEPRTQNPEPGNREPGNRELRTVAAQDVALAERQENRVSWPALPVAEIYRGAQVNLSVLRQLEARGLLMLSSREVRRDPLSGEGVPPDSPPPLTHAQRDVYEQIAAALDRVTERDTVTPRQGDTVTERDTVTVRQGDRVTDHEGEQITKSPSHQVTESPSHQVFLLQGVTGSGKTEVYLRSIARVMRLGKQALVLVPEIALTAQLVRRFAARFPGQLAVLHSGLSLGERYDEWRRLRRGEARLAIGSRSAVFAPLPDLGLIIVDEEHELTYKHDGSPRYHARDAAIQLGELCNAIVILGSATPAVESYHAARQGCYRLLEMNERVGGGIGADGLPQHKPLPLPPVRIVDMRREMQQGNRSIFSRPLQQALAGALQRNEQAILFLNRRGAASFVMCRDCGEVVRCPNCNAPLTVHQDEAAAVGEPDHELVCHSCRHREMVPVVCPHCLSPRIKAFGVGTQRVVEEVERLFPEARAMRWDRDSVRGKGAHSRMLDRFLRHDADVLIGTQMIAKGLDLPLVSLVGVVAADIGLSLPDFRSGERSFQLLTQVAGRAGRRSAGAQVIIQSYQPEHYALQAAQEHDYRAFYQQESAFRRQTGYPPYGRLVRFIYSGGSATACERAAQQLAAAISELLVRWRLDGWSTIGPAPAYIERLRGRWRWHLLLRLPVDTAPSLLNSALDALEPLYGWVVDVDPVHVL
jgi:primosomal protein N' (replication factor Y)